MPADCAAPLDHKGEVNPPNVQAIDALVLPPTIAALRQKMVETFDIYTVANLAADVGPDLVPNLEDAATQAAQDHTEAVLALVAFEPSTLSELVAKAEALRSREADFIPEEPGENGLARLCDDIVRVLMPWTPPTQAASADGPGDEMPTHAPLTPDQVSASPRFADLYSRWYVAMCADDEEGDVIPPAPEGYASWHEAMHVTPCRTVGDAFIKMRATHHPELGLISCGDGQWHGDALDDVMGLLERLATGEGVVDILSQEAALLAHTSTSRSMPLNGDADDAKCQEENRLAWVAIRRITAAPCDSLCAVRAKLRVALDLLLREGSNWTDQEDMFVLEQAIAFLEQAA